MNTFSNYLGVYTPGVIQFENANEGRAYPFAENASLEAEDGKILNPEVITDVHLVIPKQASAFLSSVYISEKIISACIKVTFKDKEPSALSVIVKFEDFQPYTPYRLEKLTGGEDIGGVITFGSIRPEDYGGTYRFPDNALYFEDSTVSKFTPAKVRSFIDDRSGNSINGDVTLKFSSYLIPYKEEGALKLKLTEGAKETLLTKCDREKDINACGATPITSINGVAPDSKDRIVIWFH